MPARPPEGGVVMELAHVVEITRAPWPDDDQFDIEIHHQSSCPAYMEEGCLWYHCALQDMVDQGGFWEALEYSGTRIVVPGLYVVAPWFEKVVLPECTEYDAGLVVVSSAEGRS